MLDEYFSAFEFNEPTDCDIEQINGIELPNDYLEFMHMHNGGEGPVGENAYLQLVRLEEAAQLGEDYKIQKYFDDIFVFGTDLGGMLFGYDASNGMYCSIDCCSMCKEDVFYGGDSFEGFIRALDAGEL